MGLPEYPPEWDEDTDEDLPELDFDDAPEPDDYDDDAAIDRALHDYERKIYRD